ncbi:transcriptional repressor TraM [Rhizobium sp. TRM95796]|uniref:transcriptional repressor TraM n=1 Tax=Rhizobium sp. TRM95796 TaxID=2979862 RepID=UPI0021E98825|nr:transcriptional repressor TraM [Rhizobium sp. TRM95796]MCV3768182.1 transcriptional repressor TraM [Rhizobium sp. TRM95796]
MDNPKIVLRPLIGLLEGQPIDMIERLTIEAISKHRCLVSEAELAYDRYKKQPGEMEISEAREAYLSSMIAVHAQQTVVSTLIDILGYIPPMPTSKAH